MVEDGGEQLGGPFSVDVVLSTLATASKAHATPRRDPGAGGMAPNWRVVTRMEEVESERRGPSLEIQSVRRQLSQPAEARRSVTPTFSVMCSGSTAAPTI